MTKAQTDPPQKEFWDIELKKVTRRMAQALTGVGLADGWPDFMSSTRLVESTRPPSYLVRATLELVFGYRLRKAHDKSAWGVPITCQGREFEISDYKRAKWNIYGGAGDTEVASELKRKISAAARILDGYLKKACRVLRAEDSFALNNDFHRYEALFEFFRAECEARFEDPDLTQGPEKSEFEATATVDPETGNDIGPRIRLIQSSLGLLLENSFKRQANLLAATIFFFSMTEVIFDACFALGDRNGKSFKDFRSLDWSERFRLILPLADDEVRRLYDRLLEIRRLYRNSSVHSNPVFAFVVGGVGLIPATFDDLDKPTLMPLQFSEKSDAIAVLDCLVSALDLFERHPETQFGFAYAVSGSVIHISEGELVRYRENMSSIETFRTFLYDLSVYSDMAMDM